MTNDLQRDTETNAGHVFIRFSFPSTLINVRAALSALVAALKTDGLQPDQIRDIEVALAEACNNIVEHAYAENHGTIDVAGMRFSNGIRFVLTDDGLPISSAGLSKEKQPDLNVEHCDLPEGGFGRSLINSLTESVRYQRLGDKNQLSIWFRTQQ